MTHNDAAYEMPLDDKFFEEMAAQMDADFTAAAARGLCLDCGFRGDPRFDGEPCPDCVAYEAWNEAQDAIELYGDYNFAAA